MVSLLFVGYIKLLYFHSKIKTPSNGINCVGLPVIKLHPVSSLSIAENVTIVSRKYSNPLGINKRSIIKTLGKNAAIIIMKNTGMSGVTICCANRITIGRNVIIGANCTIIDTDFHDYYEISKREYSSEISKQNFVPNAPVIIEDNVKIGMNVTILKGVKIGRNTIVAANSVVVRNVPSDVIIGGNPAKVLKVIK